MLEWSVRIELVHMFTTWAISFVSTERSVRGRIERVVSSGHQPLPSRSGAWSAIPRWSLVECRTVVIRCTEDRSRVCSHLLRVDPRPGVLNELPGTSGSGWVGHIPFRQYRTRIRAACAPVEREHPCCSNRAPGSRSGVYLLRDQSRKRSLTLVDPLAADLNGLC